MDIHIFAFCPTNFFWNQLSLQLISKEIRRAEREYMNMHPPINALVTALIFVSMCMVQPVTKMARVYNGFKNVYAAFTRRKTIESTFESPLRRCLVFWDLFLLGVGGSVDVSLYRECNTRILWPINRIWLCMYKVKVTCTHKPGITHM